MKIIILTVEESNKELLQELKQILSVEYRNNVEHYILYPSNLPRVQAAGADLVITINLSGFEFTTLTGGISYNLWNNKFVHFMLERNLKNEWILKKPLSISMFFYCVGKEYKEYLKKMYPEIPYLEEISGQEDETGWYTDKSNVENMVYAIYRTAQKCNLPFASSPVLEAERYFRQLKAGQEKKDIACRRNLRCQYDDVGLGGERR